MTADFGPCSNWTPRWNCDVSTASPTATGIAVTAATQVLWGLSGRRFGTCSVTLRPCRKDCYNDGWWGSYGMPWSSISSWPGDFSGYPWFPAGCGSCTGTCSCAEISEVILPSPVNSITSVKVDGVALTGTAYRVDNNRFLVRTDGLKWPRCNNLNLADTSVGTWSVTAAIGEDVPEIGQLAVGELACELLKAMDGEECRLPPGVTQLTRQGVTVSIPDFGELFKDGRTGLYLTDMFLAWSNPHRLMNRSRVYSVDRPAHRRPS